MVWSTVSIPGGRPSIGARFAELLRSPVFGLFFRTSVFLASTWFLVRYFRKALEPDGEAKRQAERARKRILARLASETGDEKYLEIETTMHENLILQEVAHPSDLDVEFSSIGGLEDIIEGLMENVVLPLQRPDLFAHSSLLSPPKGVLFYGPPGTGKTMLAKAIAKESSAVFINIQVSNIFDKWYGESNKHVAALFSLARKLSPTIIFIDEIDAFLRSRNDSDHEATATLKAEFMTHWDGLATGNEIVCVLGATNRIHSIDDAILRRMPCKFEVPLPDFVARESILRKILAGEKTSPSFDYERIAHATEGLSGSDLKELCRKGLMAPVRAYLRGERRRASESDASTETSTPAKRPHMRPITTKDLLQEVAAVRPVQARTVWMDSDYLKPE